MDNKTSCFDVDWLYQNSCNPTHRNQRTKESQSKLTFCDNSIFTKPSIFEFDDINTKMIEIYKELQRYNIEITSWGPRLRAARSGWENKNFPVGCVSFGLYSSVCSGSSVGPL